MCKALYQFISLRRKYLMAILTIIVLFLVSFNIVLGKPTEEEMNFFEETMRRFNMYPDAIPENGDVTDALKTFADEGLTLEFECPEGAKKKACKITIKTKWKSWSQVPKDSQGKSGFVTWRCTYYQTAEKVKIVECNVTISLNKKKMEEEGASIYHDVTIVGVLYHELLHIQLPINAMNTEDWRRELCECKLSLPGAGITGHPTINPLEKEHVEALWEIVQYKDKPWGEEEEKAKHKLKIKAIDGMTKEPLSEIELKTFSENGTLVKSLVTDANGQAEILLPPGNYYIKANLKIFNLPLEIYASPELTINRPTMLNIYITAMIVPIKFLPIITYAGIALTLGATAYMISRKIFV